MIDKNNLDLSECLNLSGSTGKVNTVSDLNNLNTGLVLVNNCINSPAENWWAVISFGVGGDTTVQVAFSLYNNVKPQVRRCAAGTWTPWNDLYGI